MIVEGNSWTSSGPRNTLLLGSEGGTLMVLDNYLWNGGGLSPQDAYTIDKKIDDGSPVDTKSSLMWASNGRSVDSTTVDQICINSNRYLTTSTERACRVSFLLTK